MRPLKMTMQAFGSYGKETTIDFQKTNQNLFLITGDTGAGKTTIFDAIVFALFGEASSSSNKKEGIVLQSQFSDLNLEPFVELIFAEGMGETQQIYTVRRVPKHLRLITRGANKGETRDISGSVQLMMPDGTEYPSKETDQKLEEVVGLTKSQFMQVAMIAQGEFMQLLRAKSDEKKVIFRKLFNTQLYQKITDELGRRRKEKEADMARIRQICQTEVSYVSVPDAYEHRDILCEQKSQILAGTITVMSSFLEELHTLCSNLEEEKQQAQRECKQAGDVRDLIYGKYSSAENLQKLFKQLETADQTLEECSRQEQDIKACMHLLKLLKAAYEIQPIYENYQDAGKTVRATEGKLKENEEKLPELKMKAEQFEKLEAEAKKQFNEELKNYSRVSDRVSKAKELFEKITAAKQRVKKIQKSLETAGQLAESKKKELTELQQQEKTWRLRESELSDAGERKAQWQAKWDSVLQLEKNAKELEVQQQEIEEQKNAAKDCQKQYVAASQKYAEKDAEYKRKRSAFYDEQAGILAGELKAHEPCPVCGSCEHPHPHSRNLEHANLTREVLEALAAETAELDRRQAELAAKAKSSADLLKEKEKNAAAAMQTLSEKIKQSMGSSDEIQSASQAKTKIAVWKKALTQEGKVLEQKEKELNDIRKSLQGIDVKKGQLEQSAEQAAKTEQEAKAAAEGCKAELATLESSKEYQTEADAERALHEAEKEKEEKEKAAQAAEKNAAAAKKSQTDAEILIHEYKQELPKQRELSEQRKTAYENMLTEKGLTEQQWQELTGTHMKNEIDALQAQIDRYQQKKAAAEGIKKEAEAAIGDQQCPDLEALEEDLGKANQKKAECDENLKVLDQCCSSNLRVYQSLEPKLKERSKIVEEHTRLDTMYRLVSGNVTDGRMDLETFVQRYYLERILASANQRFYEMSAGQFELRMVEAENAGKGKNKGLDLMVYSNVTGKEREIRTLSGGESFIAALSLALGMADQIQESSAAINLDIMFIDEGFGSLDDHSRQQAVRVLQEMAGGSKLIGIISHVTELKQEIENQLVVKKDENGSQVRWQIS